MKWSLILGLFKVYDIIFIMVKHISSSILIEVILIYFT